MKYKLCLTIFLFCSLSVIAQSHRPEKMKYACRLGAQLTHLKSYKSSDKTLFYGGNISMELPLGKRWTIDFAYKQGFYKNVQKPYNNAFAYWEEKMQSVNTAFRYYVSSRYRGFYAGITEGVLLRRVNAIIPIQNDISNRQIRVPFKDRLNSFDMGLVTGYCVAVKKRWFMAIENRLSFQRHDWSYQLGIHGGLRFD